jgi:hypothetical protein
LNKKFHKMRRSICIFISMVLSVGIANSQTYNSVLNILQANCTTSGCHTGANPAAGLDFSASSAVVYDALFETNPQNVWASSQGMKLVDAGYPERSLLYRKINQGLHADSPLPVEGGLPEPQGSTELLDKEKELIRQWIYYGAKETGTQIDYNILDDYYNGAGLPAMTPPPAPALGEGFQLHIGPLFLGPSAEEEYIYKYELRNESTLEINGLDTYINDGFSHHFLFFKDANGSINQGEGFIDAGLSAITSDTKMIGGWAYSLPYNLPAGTAYTWDANTILKYNYHMKNYSTTSVMPFEIYINVYTQPTGTAVKEMHSNFFINTNPLDYLIFAGQTKTINLNVSGNSFASVPAGEPDSLYIWTLGGHTHKFGTDYDIWKRTASGGEGEQIYEGFYNLDYTVNQGFYDYGEPPFRKEDELIGIVRSHGLHSEGIYHNTSSSLVNLGLTTNDEMQGFFIQYVTDSKIPLLEFAASPYLVVKAKLLLEGAYNASTNMMNTDLATNNLLPLSQPFNISPFNYNTAQTIASMPANVTDWVLVELRDKDNTSSIIARRAGLLRNDGILLDTDGTEGLKFDGLASEQYYIAIRTMRNIPIMSASPVSIPNVSAYDFTTAITQAQGNEQLYALESGVYGLLAGEYDGNGNINSLDYNVWRQDNAAVNMYLSYDGDANGVVNSLDYNLWYKNRSRLAIPVLQY